MSQILLKMAHPRNPPNRETQSPRFNLRLNQYFNLNLNRKILRNLSFLFEDFEAAAFSVEPAIQYGSVYPAERALSVYIRIEALVLSGKVVR